MSLHLAEISQAVKKDAHAVLIPRPGRLEWRQGPPGARQYHPPAARQVPAGGGQLVQAERFVEIALRILAVPGARLARPSPQPTLQASLRVPLDGAVNL
jgi:hypothetical protein